MAAAASSRRILSRWEEAAVEREGFADSGMW
jgi:hypothetical protein